MIVKTVDDKQTALLDCKRNARLYGTTENVGVESRGKLLMYTLANY